MQILKILNVLASTKEEQIKYLINLGTFPSTDELAIEFDDVYKILPEFLKKYPNSIFYLELLNKFEKINIIFDNMSNVKMSIFWDVSSLDFEEWTIIRALAKDVLEYINSTNLE